MPHPRRPLALDLYAGAGGLSLGMEQSGFDVVGAVEIDAVHANVHRFNFPRTPVLVRDADELTGTDLRELANSGWRAHGNSSQAPKIDAIVGGPPCQGFSAGGLRLEGDERNSQLLRFVDLVVELRPAVFCLENVVGLLEPRFDELRRKAMKRLGAAGYLVAGFDTSVDAAQYGVPQRRRRVVIMGGLHRRPRLENPSHPLVTVADALSGLPNVADYNRLLHSDEVRLGDDDVMRLLEVPNAYARRLIGLDRDPDDHSYDRPTDPSILTNSLRTVHHRKTVQRFARTSPGSVEAVSRLFRLPPDGQARTLRAGTGSDRGSHTSPRPIHPAKDRVITVREAARLHGYPDWFRFHVTNWHGHRQIGNSVPPPLAAAAGRALLVSLGMVAQRPEGAMPLGDPAWLLKSRADARATLQTLGQSETCREGDPMAS